MQMKYVSARLAAALSLLTVIGAGWLNLDTLAVKFGGTFGIPVSKDTFWLPKAIKLGLSDPVPEAVAGPLTWVEAQDGSEVGSLDVIVGGSPVDRLALARIDPSKYRFEILNEPSGKKHLEDWMRDTGAALIVNASYYGREGKPATPVVNRGVLSGPPEYESQHGAFVVKASRGKVVDLKIDRWHDVFDGAEAGLISYPLLIAPDGMKRTTASQWLANRSFIAEDKQGRIIIGTTESAFFSLDRLADFLKASLPDLKAALNLDGGPVASQGIAAGRVRRIVHGRWELKAKDGRGKLLPIALFMTAPMPVVIAVFRRQ